ncbi:methionine synthase [Pseudonocardiaceae bacterium YIM PH 21723]|nr:methionine synthase [Pseudonocardiaceae bacterium YIM PH 21723]
MTELSLAPGTYTGIGSLPGTDPLEAARIVLGELPLLPHLPELPARGVGADMIGRSCGLLVDLAVEVVPSGWRIAAHPGRDHRRAVEALRRDLDAFEEALETTGSKPEVLKLQATGPWTLCAGVELQRGHRVLTDHGAVREFAASLAEGLSQHVAEVSRRTGARIVLQLDEPSLPGVLAGRLPTASGYGTVRAVSEAAARTLLRSVIDSLDVPVVIHCCAPKPPITLLREAGAAGVAFDLSLLGDSSTAWDQVGEAVEADTTLFLGLVPSTEPAESVTWKQAAQPAIDLFGRLGFSGRTLAERVVPTPACGLAAATPQWVRRSLSVLGDVAAAFAESD